MHQQRVDRAAAAHKVKAQVQEMLDHILLLKVLQEAQELQMWEVAAVVQVKSATPRQVQQTMSQVREEMELHHL